MKLWLKDKRDKVQGVDKVNVETAKEPTEC